MALSSRRSARRSITTAAVGLLTVGFVASCGAKTSQSVTANTSSSTTAVAAPATTQPPPGGEQVSGVQRIARTRAATAPRATPTLLRRQSRLTPPEPSPPTRMAMYR